MTDPLPNESEVVEAVRGEDGFVEAVESETARMSFLPGWREKMLHSYPEFCFLREEMKS